MIVSFICMTELTCGMLPYVTDLRVAILRFSCVTILSMIKTLKIKKNGKNYCKIISFWHGINTYTSSKP